MRQIFITLSMMAVLAGMATAVPVTYATSGTISCGNALALGGITGCGTNSITFGNQTMQFVGVTQTVNPAPTCISDLLGYIQMSCLGGACLDQNLSLAGLSLTLVINQTTPAPNDSPVLIAGNISGTISSSSSTATMTFFPASVTVTMVVPPFTSYTYTPLPNPLTIAPALSGGLTAIQCQTCVASPEPATSTTAAGGIGLLLLALGWRRWRVQ